MAHLIRPWLVRYVDKDGKRCPSSIPWAKKVKERARKWYGSGIPGLPPGKRVPLATDKNVARQMLAELVKKGERGEAGLVDRATEAAAVPLSEHLTDFEASLQARGTDAKQVRLCLARCRRAFDACGFELPRDLDSGAVESYLADLRRLPRDQGGVSPQTSNYHLQAVGQFCRWMVKKGRLAKNPMLDARPGNARLNRQHDRRALTAPELAKLLDQVRDSTEVYRGLTGADRHALYLTACGTGFRSQELASLTPESFDLDADPPSAALAACRDKRKRPAVQPLPPAVAALLRDYLKDRPVGQPVWPGTWWERGAEMFKADLEAAGIPYTTKGPDGPLYADFHSLRHVYCSLLEQSGAGPKAAQSLARHSDVRLTLGRYAHADKAALAEAVGRLALPGSDTAPLRPAEQAAAGLLLLATLFDFLFGDRPATEASEPSGTLVARPVALESEKTGDGLVRSGTELKKGRRKVG